MFRIITISGLDGSGKSTQVELLKKYLESQGRRVFYFHAVKFGIVQKINDFRKKYCPLYKLTHKDKPEAEKSVIRANWIQIQLRKIAFSIDLCRFEKLIKKLEKEGYDYLVSDRYFHDNVVNIEYLKKQCHCERSEAISKINNGIATSPSASRNDNIIKPDLSIYIQTTPEIIMQRDRIPDQGIEYLKKKKELYDAKIGEWNLIVIDGNKDKAVILSEIKSCLGKI